MIAKGLYFLRRTTRTLPMFAITHRQILAPERSDVAHFEQLVELGQLNICRCL
jgi:hypothetical protein